MSSHQKKFNFIITSYYKFLFSNTFFNAKKKNDKEKVCLLEKFAGEIFFLQPFLDKLKIDLSEVTQTAATFGLFPPRLPLKKVWLPQSCEKEKICSKKNYQNNYSLIIRRDKVFPSIFVRAIITFIKDSILVLKF